MKKNSTYQNLINEKFMDFSYPSTDTTWTDMMNILDREKPKKKRRFGFWLFTFADLLVASLMLGGLALGLYFAFAPASSKEEMQASQHAMTKSIADHKPTLRTSDKEARSTTHKTASHSSDTKKMSLKLQSKTHSTAEQQTSLTKKPQQHFNEASINEIVASTTKTKVQNGVLGNDDGSRPGSNLIANEDASTQTNAHFTKNIDQPHLIRTNGQRVFAPSGKMLQPVKNPIADSATIAKKSNLKFPAQKRGWVVGGGLNYNIPLSKQEMSTAGTDGAKNFLMDFLPSVYAQFHFNYKWSVETSFQFSSPQYIQNLKLYSSQKSLSATQKEENAVWLNKLYYLNVPVSVHYKPTKNLTVGAGIQYSYLKKSLFANEVAVWDNTDGNWKKTASQKTVEAKSNSSVKKDKANANGNNGNGGGNNGGGNIPTSSFTMTDTLAMSLRSNDWRFLIDANYQWRRFSMGLRYNQGLNAYIHTEAGNNVLPVDDKNQAFQVYLRYNVFDNRKKK